MSFPSIQWYPGHIAKAEKALQDQLKRVDVVLEVRDARIPLSTLHPNLEKWIAGSKRVLVINRVDMITPEMRDRWQAWFKAQGQVAYFTDGNQGKGVGQLSRAAQAAGVAMNKRRQARGMLPRPVRAVVVGFPNVGKSALINRLLKQRVVESARKAGVTRQLRWVRISEELELLDSPGIIPSQLDNQEAALKLAICDDIGQAAYDTQRVASAFVELINALDKSEQERASDNSEALFDEAPLNELPLNEPPLNEPPLNEPALNVNQLHQRAQALQARYGINPTDYTGETYLLMLAEQLFQGSQERAARKLLIEFRKGVLGKLSLESPPDLPSE